VKKSPKIRWKRIANWRRKTFITGHFMSGYEYKISCHIYTGVLRAGGREDLQSSREMIRIDIVDTWTDKAVRTVWLDDVDIEAWKSTAMRAAEELVKSF